MIAPNWKEERKHVRRERLKLSEDERATAVARRRRVRSRSERGRDAFKEALLGTECQACLWSAEARGLSAADALDVLHAHHIIPVSCGGTDARANLIALCPNCHAIAHKRGRILRLDAGKRLWEGPSTKDELLMSLFTSIATASRKGMKR